LTNGKSMPKVLCLNQRPRIVAASVSAGWNGYRQTTIDSEVLEAIVNLIPEEWLQGRGRRHGSGIERCILTIPIDPIKSFRNFYKGSTKCTRKTYMSTPWFGLLG
jgi:hypothetical protein